MKKLPKDRPAIVRFFAPGPEVYDNLRSRRILFYGILAGLIFAVVFGTILYYMTKNGQLGDHSSISLTSTG